MELRTELNQLLGIMRCDANSLSIVWCQARAISDLPRFTQDIDLLIQESDR
jgi:hypothetical protein